MKIDNDIEKNDADDTGICLNYIDNDADDPTFDLNLTGRSMNHLDAQCEPDPFTPPSIEAVAYQDPLGDVELGDMDDTGICMGYIDPEIDDPTSEVDMSGSEVNRLYN